MTILRLQTTDASLVLVTYKDGRQVTTALPSGDGPTQRAIEDALASGLVIEPYVPPPVPPRLYTSAEIAAAIGRWGAAGEAATEALTGSQWFALTAGNIPATHPAMVALLSAAGKTAADI